MGSKMVSGRAVRIHRPPSSGGGGVHGLWRLDARRRIADTESPFCSTWVAHPALAAIASDIFNKNMPTPNQLFNRREDVSIGQNDLLNMNVPGQITEAGIRKNLNIGLGYMEAWIRGIGCVPINYLM